MAMSLLCCAGASAECDVCRECEPRVAIKTNMVHDALLTPDLGVEIGIGKRFSIGVEGVWAWWSHESRHRCWRIAGGWLEARWWPGRKSVSRVLTGHHVGVYGSMHTYDFEFGHKGWQCPGWTYGMGISYGYSFPLNGRLNLDVSCRMGYSSGNVTEYVPQCGMYVCTSHKSRRYLGPTGIEVTLVWFPGKGVKNSPVYNL